MTIMTDLQLLSDKTAIGLSSLCAIHCLALPLAVVLLPSLGALHLNGEVFHLWMVFVVVPVSVGALAMGCRNHRRFRVLLPGGLGLAVLVATVLIGHEALGETLEKTLTVLGSSLIVLAHWWNYRLCQHGENCSCPEHS